MVGGTGGRRWSRRWRSVLFLSTDRAAGAAVATGAQGIQAFHRAHEFRSHTAGVVCGRPLGTAGQSDGRAHRFSHDGRAKLSSWRVERDLVEVREATAWTTPSGKRPRYGSMKMHSPGHSSADSTTRSSCDSGEGCQAGSTFGLPLRGGIDRGSLAHIGEAVIEENEHIWRNLLTQAIAGAKVLINPHFHVADLLTSEGSRQ